MRKASVLSALAVLTVALGAQTRAPEAGTKQPPVSLSAVVTQGKHEDPVQHLSQSSFTVLDNGSPQPLTSFHAVAGQTDPVKILIVLDAVNVGYERLAYEREQVEAFLKSRDGQLSQPTALAVFTDSATQIQPGYTTDGNTLSAVLKQQEIGLRNLRRSSGFYGAEERLQLSLKTLSQLLAREQSQPGRKFIVWMTPGWPFLSGPAIQLSRRQEQEIFREVQGFSDAFRRAHTTFYVVDPLGTSEGPGRTFYYQQFLKGLRKPAGALPGDLSAQVLALQSGGRFLSSSNDLKALLQRCFADAEYRYELTYQPPPAEAGQTYHRIELKLSQRDATVHTLQGYYTTPANSTVGAVPAP